LNKVNPNQVTFEISSGRHEYFSMGNQVSPPPHTQFNRRMGSCIFVVEELNFQYRMEENDGVGSRSMFFLMYLEKVGLKGNLCIKGKICKHQETKHGGDKIEVNMHVSLLKVLIVMIKVPRKMFINEVEQLSLAGRNQEDKLVMVERNQEEKS
jgi:hypothetical protein